MNRADPERRRSALASLSTVGAALAGLDAGLLLARPLGPLAWPIFLGGGVVHLVGMAGTRRVRAAAGYRPAAWEQALYWLCWGLVVLLAASLAWALLR